jgi:uncharacterized protein YacL
MIPIKILLKKKEKKKKRKEIRKRKKETKIMDGRSLINRIMHGVDTDFR